MNEILNGLAELINNNYWIAPLISLLAGAITAFTPCSLSSIPLIIGYVGGYGEKDTRKALKLSLIFACGMAITFTVLGAISAILGRLMQGTGNWWYLILGILMVLMSLQTMEIFTFIKPTYLQSKNNKKGYLGALLTGILGGMFSSPCSTPVLIVLLAIVANSGSISWGILLLLLYSIGNSILVVIVGTTVGIANQIKESSKYKIFNVIIKYIMGIIILMIGLYMLYLGF